MYNKVDSLNLINTEDEVLSFWKKNNIKEKCLNHNKGKTVFSFYEGPPTANGQPHTGHLLTRALKDVFTRYKSMKGFFVPRKGGWDTHGLPVEISVEKEIGISGKQQIEEYGVEKFIEKCKENVWKYVSIWKEFSDRVGYFIDMENDCYITYEDYFIESEWWALKELDKKGLLYKGYKILPSCPHCGTSLSSHEVAQGYEDKTDLTVVAKFELIDEPKTFFLAWTTTPWTLPSNIALCVNAKEEYVKLETADKNKYILAKELAPKFFKEGEFKILETYKGKDLEYKKYKPLFNFVSKEMAEKGFYVTCDNYVTLDDGTGIVHIAPAFGEDDSRVGGKYNLPFIQLTNKYGKFTEETKSYAGLNVFDNNELIAKDLRDAGKIFKQAKHTHSYPHCWRCHSPLIYFARDSWFVKTTAIKDKLLENNKKINWLPESIKNGRMGNWLESVIDWGISRDRYWGTPLPVWKCTKCDNYHVVGSKKELLSLSGSSENIELHKPYVDNITLKCKCGSVMKREPEVIDCWFDSGSMPFAQFHYPFENSEEFNKRFPAKFISEGVDQCRGWFYTMLVLGTALFDKSPYENCLANGFVVDEKGQKLSKSLGNYTPPIDLINMVGADAVRWTFYTQAQPWQNLAMTPNIAKDSYKNFFGSLWNTYAFFALYADIDKFNPAEHKLENCVLSIMDKWILGEFNALVKTVTEQLDRFHNNESSKKIQEFVEVLSNWYIRRSRKRFWVGGFTEDKKSAFVTLWTVLSELSKLLAPFVPFVSESMYQNLVTPFFKNAPESVHLSDYPVYNKKFISEKLSQDMNLVYKYAELGRSARTLSGIKIRQPLATLYLTDAQNQTTLSDELIKILQNELNVKQVLPSSDLSKFVTYSLKPQLKTLGPKYGALLGDIRNHLEKCNASEVVNKVRGGNAYIFEINGTNVNLSEADLLINIQQKEGFVSATDGGLGVIFDATLTEELINEGIVREFVSKVQTMRKNHGLEVTDRINIQISGSKKLEDVLLKYTKAISEDVLAKSITSGTAETYSEEFETETEKLTVYIKKA